MCILNVPFHVFMDCVFIVTRICAKFMDNYHKYTIINIKLPVHFFSLFFFLTGAGFVFVLEMTDHGPR